MVWKSTSGSGKWLGRILITAVMICCFGFLMSSVSLVPGEYFEGFELAGKPPTRDGIRWGYTDELTPVEGWKSIIPGDGYAHLIVTSRALQKHPGKNNPWPFQTISLGPVGSNHRISIRARNTAIPGVACLLFTYREKSKVDEIDIEIVAHDTQSPEAGHATGTNGGWTDVRLNTWANATDRSEDSPGTLSPSSSIRTPILDAKGRKVSHRDGCFHTYTIEWKPKSVRFLIDGVLQKVIDDVVPDYPSQVIIGMRRMPWAGSPDWTGSQTMLIDWIDIEPLTP
jgi:hypothetical protein